VRDDFPHVDGVEHRFVDAGGLRMHVAEAGEKSAPPVLLLHGWPQHWYQWRHLIGPLAAEYRVICPDLRGLGWTDAPPRRYEKEQLASDVLALMDAMGLERVRLVGHDWGGWVGYLLCLREPDRFERHLVLNIVPPLIERSFVAVRSGRHLWYQLVLAAPLLGRYTARRMGRLSERFYSRAGMGLDVWSKEERAIFLDYLGEPERANATVQYYRSFQLRELPALIRGHYRGKRLSTPTLLLFGTDDMVQDPRTLRGIERHADDFTVELVANCGHFIADQRPDLVAERALEFLGGGR
jgi:pimeloyl-ACP methyl ester carboxylesterase